MSRDPSRPARGVERRPSTTPSIMTAAAHGSRLKAGTTELPIRISNSGCASAISRANADRLPSPREAVGRGRGWGVAQQTRCLRSKLITPPPPTPPRHAQGRVEGGEKHTTPPSRGAIPPEVCPKTFAHSKNEGAGNAGCALHPRSRVQKGEKKRTRAYRFSGGTPTFPARWLYGL